MIEIKKKKIEVIKSLPQILVYLKEGIKKIHEEIRRKFSFSLFISLDFEMIK